METETGKSEMETDIETETKREMETEPSCWKNGWNKETFPSR